MNRYALLTLALLLTGCAVEIVDGDWPADPVAVDESCPSPYHVALDDRCVWSCAEGTEPDELTNTCVCQLGMTPDGEDEYGRLACR